MIKLIFESLIFECNTALIDSSFVLVRKCQWRTRSDEVVGRWFERTKLFQKPRAKRSANSGDALALTFVLRQIAKWPVRSALTCIFLFCFPFTPCLIERFRRSCVDGPIKRQLEVLINERLWRFPGVKRIKNDRLSNTRFFDDLLTQTKKRSGRKFSKEDWGDKSNPFKKGVVIFYVRARENWYHSFVFGIWSHTRDVGYRSNTTKLDCTSIKVQFYASTSSPNCKAVNY